MKRSVLVFMIASLVFVFPMSISTAKAAPVIEHINDPGW